MICDAGVCSTKDLHIRLKMSGRIRRKDNHNEIYWPLVHAKSQFEAERSLNVVKILDSTALRSA